MIKVFDLSPAMNIPKVADLDVISVPMPTSTLINSKLSAIKKLPILGEGAYGKVYGLDQHKVLKVINLRFSGECEDSPLQEIAIGKWVAKYNIPFLTPIIETELIEGHIILTMPRAKSDLSELDKNKVSPIIFAVDILKGLVILHHEGILHGDFRPHNILFFGDGSIKITDYGHARIANTRRNVHLNTSFYDAPEALHKESFAKLDPQTLLKYDVWAYAMLVAEMIVPQTTYKHCNITNYKRLIEKYRNGVSKKYGTNHILTKIVHAGLTIDIKNRCT